jgi:hypothetical protein
MYGMGQLTTLETLQLTPDKLWDICDHTIRKDYAAFIREFNKREWSVRIGRTHETFEDYVRTGYQHQESFGTGFVVDNRPIPYFHPNRSFHDEIIWLNSNLYYRTDVTFENKLVNSAIVKFYGPSRTLSIITGHASDLPYVVRTELPFIDFQRLQVDEEYEYTLMSNIELASHHKQQLWGTTELRTSLQIAARNHGRSNGTPIDRRGLSFNNRSIIAKNSPYSDRKMRTSDMIAWLKSLTPAWTKFYQSKPTMKESYEYLTALRGIGPYYGYHFSSNLSRMPGVGDSSIIEVEHKDSFRKLGIDHGNLDEDADFVVAGPGASATLKNLFPTVAINAKTSMFLLLQIRDMQHKFLDISSEMDYKYHSEATELGRFTTFGCEIASCQYNVFRRLRENPQAASARASAPISKELGNNFFYTGELLLKRLYLTNSSHTFIYHSSICIYNSSIWNC